MLKKIIYQILILSFVFLTSAQSAETGGMPQLNPEFWISQIVWLVITFGILFIVLSKFILPKISDNLETRKSQILENIENAEKQREESEKKLKEFDKIIVESKNKAKNLFNDARQKVLDDVNKKKAALEKIIDDEINAAEQEIDQLKKSSHEKITKIAIETSSDLVKKLIGEEVNNSSISAIVEDLSKKNKEKINGI
jgi:F-type H+-transporting ATPase subunit b|tara:strand:+ start:235 stop:825 length:591 start_codon:yes stop_codon:yes gene_type:complete